MTTTDQVGKTNILLESGTNELEIVEFSVGSNIYGINVAKVREIIKFPDKITPLPEAHPSIEGVINLRGAVTPIINLPHFLGMPGEIDKKSSFIIISEFNKSTVGFCVNAVDRIHRLSWTQIEPPSGILSSDDGVVVSIVKFDERMVLLLDFEKITAEIDPSSGMQGISEQRGEQKNSKIDRSKFKVLIAEDSKYILKIIVNTLEEAGFSLQTFPDGLQAWEHLNSMKDIDGNTVNDHVHMVITDIEMPQMDGLHLIKNIKSHPVFKQLPCIVFSSLISDEMARKCQSVGADGQISKPEIGELVNLVDSYLMASYAQ